MSFPSDPRDVRVELFLGYHWTDVTKMLDPDTGKGPVLSRDDIVISRGRADESGTAAPSECQLSVNNRRGWASPENPLGPYYGQLGRNTPLRVRIGHTPGNQVPNSTFEAGVSGWQAYGFGYGGGSVAQSGAQFWQGTKSALVTWPTSAGTSYIGTSGGQIDLIAGRTYTLSMYVYVPATNPDVRATVGYTTSGGYTTVKDAWTRITCTFVASGAVANHNVGVESATGTTAGQICYIDGVMVEEGATASTFTTTAPTWYPRFQGELSELPQRWGDSVEDAYVPIKAAGILRRISKGKQPANSSLKNYYLTTTPIIYWPLDDGSDVDRGYPIAGTYRGSTIHRQYGYALFTFGEGDLGPHMNPTLKLNDTVPLAGIDQMIGYCYSSSLTPNALAYDFVYRTDHGVSKNGSAMSDGWGFQAHVQGSDMASREIWIVVFRADGVNNDIQFRNVIEDGFNPPVITNLADSAPLSAVTDGQLHHVRLLLTQNGANTDYAVYVDGVSVISGTRTTHTLRQAWYVVLYYNRLAAEDLMAVGHVIAWESTANIPDLATAATLATGYIGETAGRRFERLCGETSTPFVSTGDLDDTTAMGMQFTDYFENQITEIEQTDRGMIYEPADSTAVGYRTRSSLYNQVAAATINFAAGELGRPFEPTYDDQLLANDVFAQRREGSSYQVTELTGPLSVLDPPAGIGRYKDEVAVNVETDDMLPAVAGWLLHLGTVGGARYPQITIDLHAFSYAGGVMTGPAANATLSDAVLGIDPGDRIVITNLDAIGIYDDIALIVLGYHESINARTHTITFNCAPAAPYEVNQLDAATSLIDPGDDSTLAADPGTTGPSLSVASTGPLWTTAGGDMPIPIMVEGEEMTVTAISGTSSPQTFTVTRSANDVVKAHSTGAVVRLKRPGVMAL